MTAVFRDSRSVTRMGFFAAIDPDAVVENHLRDAPTRRNRLVCAWHHTMEGRLVCTWRQVTTDELDALDLEEHEVKVNNSTMNVDTYLQRVDGRPSIGSPTSARIFWLWRSLLTFLFGMEATQSIARVPGTIGRLPAQPAAGASHSGWPRVRLLEPESFEVPACAWEGLIQAAVASVKPKEDQDSRTMTIAVLIREANGLVRHSKSPAAIESGTGQSPGKALKPVSPLEYDRTKFALFWACWEPAFVAQQHREWFS